MSEVFIPLGGAGGKNRGNSFYISDTAPTAEILGRIITPLPAGVYKKFVTPDGQVVFPSADGGDAVVSMSKEFLKKQAIKTFGIASITNFSLSMYAHRQVRLTWAKPDRGLFSGIHFVFKYDSMPTSETDGFMVYDSADVHYETAKLEERELFVRAYSYVTVKDGRWYDEGVEVEDISPPDIWMSLRGKVLIGLSHLNKARQHPFPTWSLIAEQKETTHIGKLKVYMVEMVEAEGVPVSTQVELLKPVVGKEDSTVMMEANLPAISAIIEKMKYLRTTAGKILGG